MIKIKDFQEKAVDYLLEKTMSETSKQRIILKSPTGSGKTIILISYIDKYLSFNNSIFCWLCPGKGELEKQSKEKMEKFYPHLKTGDLQNILNNGFEPQTIYFINWEKITKKDNIAISDSERKNLFERIAEAHKSGLSFITIIDEEHNNDTKKANDILNSLNAKNEIRVSATPSSKAVAEFYEIKEEDVINEGLITRFMYINKDLLQGEEIENIDHETEILLKKADEVRKQILEEYRKIDENINPLVLIQFPNMNDNLIQYVEDKLNDMGYSYENNKVACWFSDDKNKEKSKKLGIINLKNITNIDATQSFLLFKQALATGWDCPRAKILVKLRENMSEQFSIQTLGRLRRMPKVHHYDNDILDCSYLYTFDEKYKLDVINAGLGIETQRVFLKKEPRNLKLQKELRNNDTGYYSETEIRTRIYEYFKAKYDLSKDFKENRKKLEVYGYIFGEKICKSYLLGKYATFSQISESPQLSNMEILVDTHAHGIDLQHNINELKKHLGLKYDITSKIMRTLFKKEFGNKKYKLLNLTLKEYYAFIINNVGKLKEVFDDFENVGYKQLQFSEPRQEYFVIPTEEHYRYIPSEKDVKEMEANVYVGYNTSMIGADFRSKGERLFEKYCENNKNVEYVYKNGDTGQQYLSIVYVTNVGKERLFYPDYILKDKKGQIWLIETKGGEYMGEDLNIDKEVKAKFEACKHFSKKYGYNFGFVRSKDEELFINNEEYVSEMNDEKWKKLNI